MNFSDCFPIYDKLTSQQQQLLSQAVVLRSVKKDTLLHGSGSDCLGLLVIRSGQLRAYITSDQGREVTIYRLFPQDICLMSASCILHDLQFEISIAAEKDTQFWIIPPNIYQNLMENCTTVANYTNQIMATRLTDVMWLIEQVMWKRFDQRLAHFLLEESALESSLELHLTHEKIASHTGTAREVVTRMLKHFQSEGAVKLTRGTTTLLDLQKLRALSQ